MIEHCPKVAASHLLGRKLDIKRQVFRGLLLAHLSQVLQDDFELYQQQHLSTYFPNLTPGQIQALDFSLQLLHFQHRYQQVLVE